MFYFRMTIRYILAIGTALAILGFFIETFELHLLGFLVYPYIFYMIFLDCPAVVLLPIVSVCSYFVTKRFWSVFKTEYYFWFAKLGIYGLLTLISLIVEH